MKSKRDANKEASDNIKKISEDDSSDSDVELSQKKKKLKSMQKKLNSGMSMSQNNIKGEAKKGKQVALLKKTVRVGDKEWQNSILAEERLAAITKAIDR